MAATFAIFSTALSPTRSPSLGCASRLPQFTTTIGAPPDLSIFRDSVVSPPPRKIVVQAAQDSINFLSSASLMSDLDTDDVPMPIVMIDQDADPEATVVQVGFGDRLGAFIDTMKALKDLGLNVVKGTVSTEGPVKQTKLHITNLSSGRKVEDPDMLERIRLTIIGNLLKYHPESSELLAMGEAFGVKAPEKKPDVDIATHIYVQEDGAKRSMLCMETADRSGLLLEIMKIMADINLEVESAEIDTVGLVAKNKFHVSYHGAALSKDMAQRLSKWLLSKGSAKVKMDEVAQAKIVKCSESMWKLTYYGIVEACILRAIYHEPWFTDIQEYFSGYPNQELKLSVKLYYMCQCGFYLYSIAALIVWETRRKDFSVMMSHHVITVILIGFSYITRFFRIGSIILALHDASDVFMEAAKLFKYSEHELAASVSFGFFAISWLILRLIYFPFWVIRASSSHACDYFKMGPYPRTSYYIFNTMLIMLLIFHIYWWILICAMIMKQLKNKGKVGEDIRSDSEDDD